MCMLSSFKCTGNHTRIKLPQRQVDLCVILILLLLLLLLLVMVLLFSVMDIVGIYVPTNQIMDLCNFNASNPTTCSTTAKIIFWLIDVLLETPHPLRTHSLSSIPFSSLLLLPYFNFVLIFTLRIFSKCLLVIGHLLLASTQIKELKWIFITVWSQKATSQAASTHRGSEWK
jgi:hypothetical protein